MGNPRENHQVDKAEQPTKGLTICAAGGERSSAGIFRATCSSPRMGLACDQADRAISTGKLHASQRFHTRPIDVIVYHGSKGILVLRWASRLDAFSGYPFRT